MYLQYYWGAVKLHNNIFLKMNQRFLRALNANFNHLFTSINNEMVIAEKKTVLDYRFKVS